MLKKSLIAYLALATGCSSSLDTITQVKKTEDESSQLHQLPILGSAQIENPVSNFFGGSASTDMFTADRSSADFERRLENATLTQDGHDTQGIEEAESWAYSKVNGLGSAAVQKWFNDRNATVQIDLGLGNEGIRFGSFDLLAPLVSSEKSILFTQAGFRRSNSYSEDYRSTLNLGFGYRHTFDDYMLGANIFYDRDLTSENERLGLGAEAWTNNLKLSANAYLRLSEWRESPDKEIYMERPANGWDIRAEAFLPSYPQLSGSLMLEQYYGEEVALFGSGNSLRNPIAATVGLTYRPIPLLSMSTEHKLGQGGESQTAFRLGLNYQLGTPLEKQLSTDAIISANSLANARYNLVNRNNEIVLDYKADDNGIMQLPSYVRVYPGTTFNFPITITGAARNISWVGTAAPFMQAYNGSKQASINIPTFDQNGQNAYTLKAVGVGGNGLPIESNEVMISVEMMQLQLERSKPEAMADGTDEVLFTARLLNPSSEPKADSEIVWTVTGPATVISQQDITDASGQARLRLVSRAAASVQVQASSPLGVQAEQQTVFSGDPATARVAALNTDTADILANGVDRATLRALVVDASGNPVGQGVEVTWSATSGSLSGSMSVTDSNGYAYIGLSGTQIGTATVTGTSVGGSSSTAVNFIAVTTTARPWRLDQSKLKIVSNGIDATIISVYFIDDSLENVGAGVVVDWSTTLGDLSATRTVTDANGIATISLTGVKAGDAEVTAKANAEPATTNVLLVADPATARVASVTPSLSSIPANNLTASELVATVVDANGNPMGAGVSVDWASSTGSLTSPQTVTDANGIAINKITGTTVGAAQVTASSVAGAANAVVNVVADMDTAQLQNFNVANATVVAGGTRPATLMAYVSDALGNRVGAGAEVYWSTTLGNLASTQSVTGTDGIATVAFTGTVAGVATVSVTMKGRTYTSIVVITPDEATAQPTVVSVSPSNIRPNGTDSSIISTIVRDAYGNAVGAGVPVTWTTTNGSLTAATTSTDLTGMATNVLVAGTNPGVATVLARTAVGSATADVMIY